LNTNFVDIKGKTLFSMFLLAFLLISTNKVDVAAASPATHFYVDPPEVKDLVPGDTFLINISIADAPLSYSWEIYISWNPDVLEAFYKKEGAFLNREDPTTYPTNFVSYPSFAEANVAGEIRFGSNLIGDVLWASGDGWLMSLGFNVTALGSCVLDLFDTRLYDYELLGSPYFTYYPNLDGFFYNRDFPPNSLFHDIAITSVTPSPTGVTVGDNVTIDVTVTNEGNYTETSETFNVTVYADTEVIKEEFDVLGKSIKNTTVVGDEITVGTQTITGSLAPGANTTLTFTWNTTGVAGGEYTISAEAMGDNDTRNNLFIDGTVTVAAHDIAITNVVLSATEVTVGDNVTIEVTVKNEGHFNETFNVTTYYDDNAIETKTNITLTAGANTTLTFIWETTDVAKDTYTIKAVASEVPDEIDTEDNTFEDGTVKVRGAAAPDILLYAAVGIVIVIAVAIAVYFMWFRKRT